MFTTTASSSGRTPKGKLLQIHSVELVADALLAILAGHSSRLGLKQNLYINTVDPGHIFPADEPIFSLFQ